MQNPALTKGSYNPTLRSKVSDGVFCKPLQALVFAIVVYFVEVCCFFLEDLSSFE